MTNSPIVTTPLSSRTRTNSNGSDISNSSDEMKPIANYDHMNLDDLIADKLDTSALEKTRSFNPRKQRSCHKRAVPVSAEKRKEESSKNSREYTKRNRDEIKVCQNLRNDLHAKKNRLLQIMSELKMEHIEKMTVSAIKEFEKILEDGPFKSVAGVRAALRIPNEEPILQDYRLAASDADTLHFKTDVDSQEKRLEELRKELEELENKKDNLASQKEKTNYASSKSRLKQRVIRAELKVECYHTWKQIENLKIRCAKLNDCCNALKKTIWERIVSIYYNFSQTLTTIDGNMETLHQINKIIMFFLPYSKTEETVKAPKTPQQEPPVEVAKDWASEIPGSESVSTIQDSLISTTCSNPPFAPPIPPVLVSPTFTLSLPTVPMPPASPKKNILKQQILLPVVTVTDGETTRQLLPEQEENVLSAFEQWKLKALEKEDEDVEVDIMTPDNEDPRATITPESHTRKRSASPAEDEPKSKKSPMTTSSSPPSLSSLQSPPTNQVPRITQMAPLVAQQSLLDFNTAMFATLYNQIMNSPSSVSTNGHNAFNSQVQIANWLQYLGTPKNF